MIDRDLEIRTPDGDMTTFISHPEGDGPYPLILFLMDAPGKREELHDMARRLAAKGYYVMLPNLYYRRTPVFDVVAEGRDVMREQHGITQYSRSLPGRSSNARIFNR